MPETPQDPGFRLSLPAGVVFVRSADRSAVFGIPASGSTALFSRDGTTFFTVEFSESTSTAYRGSRPSGTERFRTCNNPFANDRKPSIKVVDEGRERILTADRPYEVIAAPVKMQQRPVPTVIPLAVFRDERSNEYFYVGLRHERYGWTAEFCVGTGASLDRQTNGPTTSLVGDFTQYSGVMDSGHVLFVATRRNEQAFATLDFAKQLTPLALTMAVEDVGTGVRLVVMEGPAKQHLPPSQPQPPGLAT